MYTDYERVYTNYLMHRGTKGMKWGVRKALQKYNSAYDGLAKSLNEKNKNYHTMKKMIRNDKANLNKMTSKLDIKNKAAFDGVKYTTIQNASFLSKNNKFVDPAKLNKIMEKDWTKNKVKIVKEMNTQRRLGRVMAASFVATNVGFVVGLAGIISGNKHVMNAGLAATLGGAAAGAAAGAAGSTSKLARRQDKYLRNQNIY